MSSILNSFNSNEGVAANINEQFELIPEIDNRYLMPKWFKYTMYDEMLERKVNDAYDNIATTLSRKYSMHGQNPSITASDVAIQSVLLIIQNMVSTYGLPVCDAELMFHSVIETMSTVRDETIASMITTIDDYDSDLCQELFGREDETEDWEVCGPKPNKIIDIRSITTHNT